MDKDFYIFLDIDGTMNDWAFFKHEIAANRIKKGSLLEYIKPQSVVALNHLIKELSYYYNVNLVITSTWRKNLVKTEMILRKSGLQYNGTITATPITNFPEKRGKEICLYLKDKQNYDFVIIDDELFDYKLHFNNQIIIKTNMQKGALNMFMVKEFLRYKNLNKNEQEK